MSTGQEVSGFNDDQKNMGKNMLRLYNWILKSDTILI